MGFMKIVKDQKLKIEELREMSKKMFGTLVKAVVDIEQEIMAVDADLHADQEAYLLENGSLQQNLWGINIYPDATIDAMIEFDSMINLRPSQENRSRGVDDHSTRVRIVTIVNKLIEP